MTGPPKSFAVTTGTQPDQDDQRHHDHRVRHRCLRRRGYPGNTFCIDIASGERDVRRFAELERHRLRARDRPAAEHPCTTLARTRPPATARPGTRVSITIFNNPANVLSSLTLNNLVLNISAATVGSVRAILTDCGDQFGPGGSLPGTNADPADDVASRSRPTPIGGRDRRLPSAAATAADGPPGGAGDRSGRSERLLRQHTTTRSTRIGNFSGPNDSVNDLNRVVLFFLLLADRSGGNDRVATARILQQEKYGRRGRQHFTHAARADQRLLAGHDRNSASSDPRRSAVRRHTLSRSVATADNFPDALSASYAAGRIGAAILLVRPTVDALAQVQLAPPEPRREDGPRARWPRGRPRHGRRLPQGSQHQLHHRQPVRSALEHASPTVTRGLLLARSWSLPGSRIRSTTPATAPCDC